MTPQENFSHEQSLKDLEATDHHISYEKAATMVQNFRQFAGALSAKSESRPAIPEFLTYHRKAIQDILDKPGCVALRMYPAINDKNNVTIVLVGVDGDGENIVSVPAPVSKAKSAEAGAPQALAAPPAGTSGTVDEGQTCPPYPKPAKNF